MDIDLTKFDILQISISVGKDSQVTLLKVIELTKKQNVRHQIRAVLSDTGVNWKESPEHCRYLYKKLNVPFSIVYPAWTIPDYIDHRLRFPSVACRFCMSQKTGSLDKTIRHLAPARERECQILSITGERREESSHQAKLEEFELNEKLTAGNREVWNYCPILNYKIGKM